MDGPEPKTPADALEGGAPDPAPAEAAAPAPAAAQVPVAPAPHDAGDPGAEATGALASEATEPLVAHVQAPAPSVPAAASATPSSPTPTPDAPVETPDTALAAPSPPPAAPARRGWKAALSPLRVAVAIVGGLAALGAIALPLSLRARQDADPAMARAASMAGVVAAAAPTVEEAVADGGGDAGDDADAGQARAGTWRVARLADDATVTLVEGAMGKRPLLAALAAAGLPRTESRRVVDSLEGVRDVDHFDPKDTFVLARDKPSGRVVAYEFGSSPVDVWQAREEGPEEAPRLVARRLRLVSERVRVRKAILVGADLRASFADAGMAPVDEVLALLDDALEGHAELSDIRAGARLRIVATAERVDGAFVRWASLDAVEYLPAASGAPPVRVYWLGEEGRHHGWYDAKGRQPTHGGWRMPLPFARVVSRFNPHRMHPVLHVVMPHNGVDFGAPTGAPVYATAPGVVVGVGNDGPCGNKVEISHSDNISSVYCHLSRFASGLHVGQHVEGRQLIAYVGQTGRVTGPHLHFGIKRGGVFIDPMTLRLDGMRVVPRGRRDDFDRARAQLDAELDGIPLPAPAGVEAPRPDPSAEVETIYEEP